MRKGCFGSQFERILSIMVGKAVEADGLTDIVARSQGQKRACAQPPFSLLFIPEPQGGFAHIQSGGYSFLSFPNLETHRDAQHCAS